MNTSEVDLLIKEIYEWYFGMHANGNIIFMNILRDDYYWLTIESVYFSYVKKYHKFQLYTDKVHVHPTPLNVMM